MVVDEPLRYQLHQRLDEVLGADVASTLMAYLPPVGWADVATRRDLNHLEERIDARFGSLFESLDARLARVDARIDHLDTKIDGVEERLGLRLEALEHKVLAGFRGELTAAVTSQTRSLMFAMAGVLFTATSVAYTAARLG